MASLREELSAARGELSEVRGKLAAENGGRAQQEEREDAAVTRAGKRRRGRDA